MTAQTPLSTTILPATPERWNDLEALFGPKGACLNCWCMYWRLKRSDFNALSGAERKAALRELTTQSLAPGLLAYVDGEPAGWISIAPRQDYEALKYSRNLKPVDDQPVWSIVCFFVDKKYRKKGMTVKLLKGAMEYARLNGARVIEGYPLDLDAPKLAGYTLSGSAGYEGSASAFRTAGFVEVKRASKTQLVMRYTIDE